MKTISQNYIDQLILSLNDRCKGSKTHNDKYRSVYANNRAVAGFNHALKDLMFTLIVEKAKGPYLYDIDGNKYLDLAMGFGVHLFGHSPDFLNDAIRKQMEKGISLGPLFPEAAEVSQLIHDLTGVQRSAFFNSGTEAVMVAIRLAKAATQKSKIVIFAGSYHGTFDSLLALKTDPITKQALDHIPGISKNIISDTLILKYGSQESLEHILKHKDEIAAVLVEPVQSRNPELQPKEFLQDLRKICTDYNIALVFDEIVTGFRISNGGAMAHFGVSPDLVTFGKALGGGMPLGVVSGKEKFMNFIDGGLWNFKDESIPSNKMTFVAGTFCHHPASMAAAKEVLNQLKQSPEIQGKINETTLSLANQLNPFFEEHNFSISIVCFGSLFRFKLKGNARYLYYGLLNEGVYIWEGRTCFLSTAHKTSDIDFLIEKVKKVCLEMSEAELI